MERVPQNDKGPPNKSTHYLPLSILLAKSDAPPHTPSSPTFPVLVSVPDAAAAAYVTATETELEHAKAYRSAIVEVSGNINVYMTANSIDSATSDVHARAHGSAHQPDNVTSATIDIHTQSAPSSPAKTIVLAMAPHSTPASY
uniref:Uncharacterized protein n=1 Tax=Moniliophthora roreri TaxID=221103 RepID=A0A0W0G372_MONRR